MKTEELISALSRELEPAPRPSINRRLALIAGLGAVAATGLLLVTVGLRDEFGSHVGAVMAKAAFSAVLAIALLPVLVRLARPGRPLGWRAAAGGGALLLSLAIAGIALIGVDPAERWEAWTGGGFPWCLVIIPALATPAAAGLIWLLRDLAPTRLGAAGAAIGAFSGGIGAMVYAMYCPIDTVPFVATWYALAIAVCAALGTLIAGRFLRW